jgi:ABC-type tungstate transport system permease subunit
VRGRGWGRLVRRSEVEAMAWWLEVGLGMNGTMLVAWLKTAFILPNLPAAVAYWRTGAG